MAEETGVAVALGEVLRSLRERPDIAPDETLCARLGLLPLVCLGPQRRAPISPRRAMGVYLAAVATNRRLRRAMCDVGRALGPPGIPAIVYKGQDYLDRLYGDLGGREMADVDVLVRPIDLEGAEQALTAAGFVPGAACRTAPHERKWTSDKATVDLHHALLQPGRMRVDYDALFARALPCSAAPGLRVLEPTDALLVHSIGHAVYGLCVPPSWYVEFQWLLARADAGLALRRAADYDARSAWYCSLYGLARVGHPEAASHAADVPLSRSRRAVLNRLVGFGLDRLGHPQPTRPVRLAIKLLLIDRLSDAARMVPRWSRWALAAPRALDPVTRSSARSRAEA